MSEILNSPETQQDIEAAPSGEELAENWLEENRLIFAQSNANWRNLRALHEESALELVDLQEEMKSVIMSQYATEFYHTQMASRSAGGRQYATQPRIRFRGTPQEFIDSSFYHASLNVQAAKKNFATMPDLAARIENIEQFIQKQEGMSLEEFGGPELQSNPEGVVRILRKLYCQAVRAYGYDFVVFEDLKDLWQNNSSAVVPFAQRCIEISELADEGFDELPGFLPLIATKLAEEGGKNNILKTLDEELMKQPYHEDFITNAHEQKNNPVLEFLLLSRKFILEGSDEEFEQYYLDRVISSYSEWPDQLKRDLEKYRRSRVTNQCQLFSNTLNNFTRKGRIPKPPLLPGNTGLQKLKKQRKKPPQASSGRDVVTQETKHQPIQSFRLTKNKPSKNSNNTVDFTHSMTIEEILQSPLVQDYIKAHRDQIDEPTLRTAITTLADDPVNPLFAKALRGANRPTINGVRLRRAKISGMPLISNNLTTRRTRILFGLQKDAETKRLEIILHSIQFRDDHSYNNL